MTLVNGRVSSFDEHRGLGKIITDDGTVYSFHCTMIADGTRTIAVDTDVKFEISPGPLGRWEATAITPA